MTLKQFSDEFIMPWLPTTSSKMAASLTLALVTGIVLLPQALEKTGISCEGKTLLIIRYTIPPWILFLGTLIILVLVIKHFNAIAEEQPSPISLDDFETKLLKFIFDRKRFPSEIEEELNLKKEEANYYINNLQQFGFISCPNQYSTDDFKYYITQEGREYIMKINP